MHPLQPCSEASLAVDDRDGMAFNHFKFGSVSATQLEPYPWYMALDSHDQMVNFCGQVGARLWRTNYDLLCPHMAPDRLLRAATQCQNISC